jgi:hypothetical protein
LRGQCKTAGIDNAHENAHVLQSIHIFRLSCLQSGRFAFAQQQNPAPEAALLLKTTKSLLQ